MTIAAITTLMRRLSILLTSAAVACSLLISGPQPTSAQGGACIDDFNYNWSYVHKDPSGGSSSWVFGVKGWLYTAGVPYFDTCTHGVGDDAAAVWVSIDPGSGQPYDMTDILQIGFQRCTYPPFSACGDGLPHLWWARGGCGTNIPVPFDLGIASHGTHTYEITFDSPSNDYKLKADGVQRASIDRDAPGIGCWANGDTEANWAVERWDRGDSGGSNGTTSQRTQLTNLWFKFSTGSWSSPGFTECFRTITAGTGYWKCTVGSQWLHTWTIY